MGIENCPKSVKTASLHAHGHTKCLRHTKNTKISPLFNIQIKPNSFVYVRVVLCFFTMVCVAIHGFGITSRLAAQRIAVSAFSYYKMTIQLADSAYNLPPDNAK